MNKILRPAQANMKSIKLYRHRTIATIIKIAVFAILYSAFSSNGWTVEDPYAIISQKNLFHPDRKEWIMESSDKKADDTKASVPKLDPQKVKLQGTVIVGDEHKAIVSTTGNIMAVGGRMPKRAIAGAGNAEIYMVGDFIEGYLLKEVNEKNILLSSPDGQDAVTIFLHEGSKQRSSEKTPVPAAPAPVVERRVVRQNQETPQMIQERMKKSMELLKGRDNERLRRQVERDFTKLRKNFPAMSQQEQQEAILMKKELERKNAEKQ
jgi:hypothetical protein